MANFLSRLPRLPLIPRLRRAAPARVHTPTILQMEAVECGAAALGIILAWHGRHVSLEELRLRCGVSRDGSKASNVVRAARGYGLEAQGMRLEIEMLREHGWPMILFWNFNHFLVLEGLDNQRAWLNDPATGPRVVSMEEFSRSYTGVALLFAPGPGFTKTGRPPSVLAALAPRLKGAGSGLAYVLIASLALVIPGLAIPVFSQVFIDSYLIGRLDGWVKPLLFGMAFAALLRAALTWLQQTYLLRLESRLSLAAAAQFFWHVLRLPVEFFNQRYAGDIAQRMSSNDSIAQLLSGQLATNAVALVTLAFYAAVMLAYDPWLALACMALTALNAFVLLRFARRRRDGYMRLQQDRGKLMSVLMAGIQTMETIKSNGGEDDFFQRWAGWKARVNNTEQQLGLLRRVLSAVPLLIAAANTALIFAVGGARVMSGEMSVGMLVAFQSLLVSFAQPVGNLMNLASDLQQAHADLRRLDDVLAYPRERGGDGEQQRVAAADKLEGALELKDLRFGYSRLDAPLLDGFSLELEPGQRVALVGGSGSGKSTVAKLIMGLYQPWSGEILFDGQRRAEIPAAVLHASLASVDQDIYLFSGSVRDNLTLWDASLPEPDMVQAAQDAAIHGAIVSRNGGYDSEVSEGGANFSGGQRQRLEIARALAGNPRLLVLDEATSALDPSTEQEIDSHLRRRGCTCVIIAHRLSTVRDCDEIIVMERGRIVERGSHDALLQQGGAYARLLGEIAA
jgi:NHLM bacteriocin system ABC transporter peptidase/ATP-binding protein